MLRARRLSQAGGGEEGSASAELVVATPLLLILILAVVQFALWQHATHVAQTVAGQALAAGRIQGGTDTAATAQGSAVLDQLGSGVLVHPNITATRGAEATTVVVTGRAEAILPFLSLPVHTVATGPTERWTTPGNAGGGQSP